MSGRQRGLLSPASVQERSQKLHLRENSFSQSVRSVVRKISTTLSIGDMKNDIARMRQTSAKGIVMNTKMKDNRYQTKDNDHNNSKSKNIFKKFGEFISRILFPELPEYYPFRKKLMITKTNSTPGMIWDLIQIILAFLLCSTYAASTYSLSLRTAKALRTIELAATQLFAVEFLVDFYLRGKLSYLIEVNTIIDMLTIFPVYLDYGSPDSSYRAYKALDWLRCLRVLKILQTLFNLKAIQNMSGVKRQIITLIFSLICLTYLSASFIQLLETTVETTYFDCKYINELTEWTPSCSETSNSYFSSTCDCQSNMCEPNYFHKDNPHEPSLINCQRLTFYDAFYFIVVTGATVGYGDIHPTTQPSKGFIILFIMASLIVTTMRVQQLQRLLSQRSIYRTSYNPSLGDNHIIVCGYVNNAEKLSKFFHEFFHPDRVTGAGQEFHAIVLSPVEPAEDVREVLQRSNFESKIDYVQGSALGADDLKRVRAETASCVFFICNTDIDEKASKMEDAATVLRALSVSNFNPNLDCLVQVLRPEDRSILRDSDIDVVLCLEEFKTAVQARNSLCPGFSTFVENIFHSMEAVSDDMLKVLPPWYREYLHGAGMELYFVQLNMPFIKAMKMVYRSIVEAIFLEFDVIVLGLCNADRSALVFNPNVKDIIEFDNAQKFFGEFNIALVLASDQTQADEMTKDLSDPAVLAEILSKMELEEEVMQCNPRKYGKPRAAPKKPKTGFGTKVGPPMLASAASLSKLTTKPTLETVNAKGGILSGGILSAMGFHNIANETIVPTNTDDEDSDPLEEPFSDDDDDVVPETYIGYRGNKAHQHRVVRQSLLKESIKTPKSELNTIIQQDSEDKDEDSDDFDAIEEIHMDDGGPFLASVSDGLAGGPARRLMMSFTAAEPRLDDFVIVKTELKYATDHFITKPGEIGCTSCEIEDARLLRSHIIASGSERNISLFIEELRRPEIYGMSYHPILFVANKLPEKWNSIIDKFNDVYFMRGSISNLSIVSRLNLANAWSVTFLSQKADVNSQDKEGLDAPNLFCYLKIEQYIPNGVFCSVELNSASNMAVLNTQVMRRARKLEAAIAKAALIKKEASQMSERNGLGPQKRPLIKAATTNKMELDSAPVTQAKLDATIKEGTRSGRRDSAVGFGQSNIAHKNTKGFDVETFVRGDDKERTAASLDEASLLEEAKKETMLSEEKLLWEILNTHHVFPVFACAAAYHPSSFESLLVQSFYVKLTPVICEKFVCGQLGQTVVQVPIPPKLVGRSFLDIFRLFIGHQVLCFAVYRAPSKDLSATLPYVYVSPPQDTVLKMKDALFVFGNATALEKLYKFIELIKFRG